MPKQPVKLAAAQTLAKETDPLWGDALASGLQDYDEWLIAAYKETTGHYPLSYRNVEQLLYNPRTKVGKRLLQEVISE